MSDGLKSQPAHQRPEVDFKVEAGMQVFVDHHANGQRSARRKEVKDVVKVGRAWVYYGHPINPSRVDRARLESVGWAPADQMNSSEDVYVSRDVYDAIQAEHRLRRKITSALDAYAIKDVPLDSLRQIAQILEIKHEVPSDWK